MTQGQSGQVGFNNTTQSGSTSGCQCDITSTDDSILITETQDGYDLKLNVDLCQLVASAPDNGLIVGG